MTNSTGGRNNIRHQSNGSRSQTRENIKPAKDFFVDKVENKKS